MDETIIWPLKRWDAVGSYCSKCSYTGACSECPLFNMGAAIAASRRVLNG